MEHHFNVDVAKEVGVNAATILNHIIWWCQKNASDGNNFHDGRYWTYNSAKSLSQIFPYLTENQIRTATKKLADSGFVVTGDYSSNRYARPVYYSPTRKALEMCGASMFENDDHVFGKNQTRRVNSSSSIFSTVKDTVADIDRNIVELPRQRDVGSGLSDKSFEVLSHLNSRCGRSYRRCDSSLKEIKARLREGYSVETLCSIIDFKASQWEHDRKMRDYLRPSTLFRATNCMNYEQEMKGSKTAEAVEDFSKSEAGVW